jgi:hypothetical protein
MADPPVFITSRNTVGIKLDDSGYTLGIGNRGLELFASSTKQSAGITTRVDYGLLTIDQPGAELPTLRSGKGELPQGRDVISSSFLGTSFSRPLSSSTTLLGYGGLTRHGDLVVGARAEHRLSADETVSVDLQKRGVHTSASALYEWGTGTTNTTRQDFKLGVALDNSGLSLSGSYAHEKRIDLQGLGYLRTQLGAAATLGPAGQFSAAATASVMKDIYTYHVSGIVPVTFEAGINHTVQLGEKPKTAVVWQLKLPI